jgi:hypothetical protein
MTLSPVFRSLEAVNLLEGQGIWKRMSADISAQARAVRAVREDLGRVIGERYLAPQNPLPGFGPADAAVELEFLQEFFFLILFRSVFESLRVAPNRLDFYSEINFCIKGTITAADDLFDDQDKSLLPLNAPGGPRYGAIMQLMCFERLIQRVCDRALEAGVFSKAQREDALRRLLTRMAGIGELEGSEEGGVQDIPSPEEMIETVHRVRGGALFALAFAVPGVLESGEVARALERAEEAIARLGTAFQIVDDLTDFEFDLGRRSHNLLVAQIRHHGQPEARRQLETLWDDGRQPDPGMVEGVFRSSARAVLEAARIESRAAFEGLEALGYWFPPNLSDQVVRAIVGLDGVGRMEAISGAAGSE